MVFSKKDIITSFKSSNFPKFDPSDYDVCEEEIGRGAYGSVFSCVNINTNKKFALKRLFPSSEKSQIREIDVMVKLQHPCLCGIIGSYLANEDDEDEMHIELLLPYMSKGNLNSMNNSKDPKWDITTKMKALYGIAVGMDYMHKNHAIHRDLKPENILLDENYEIKISDFGLSRFLGNEDNGPLTFAIGTPFFMAPELAKNENYTEKVDVFSYAVILYQILYSTQCPKVNFFKHIQNVCAGGRLPLEEAKFKYGKPLFQLITDCWAGPPMARPSFADILLIIPDFLPEGTNVPAFKEYARRVNPDFEANNNPKIKERNKTYIEIKKSFMQNSEEKTSKNDDKEEDQVPVVKNISIFTAEDNGDDDDDNDSDKNKDDDTDAENVSQSDSDETPNQHKNIQTVPDDKIKISIVDTMKLQAEMGNPKELFNYGMILYNGSNGVKKNIPEAIEKIKAAAKYKCVDAYYFLGVHYLDGSEGFELNLKESRKYFHLAAEADHPLALFLSGFYDERGLEVYPPKVDPKTITDREKYIWPANKEEGFKYTKKAAEKGHSMSALIVARSYENGIQKTPDSDFFVKKDEAMATKYYQIAADSGHSPSMVKFAQRAEQGIGMKKNPQIAVLYIQKAAKQYDDMHALFILGNYYFKGLNGCKKKQKAGADLIKKAADKGYVEAQIMYAKILKKGADGVKKDHKESKRYEMLGKKK